MRTRKTFENEWMIGYERYNPYLNALVEVPFLLLLAFAAGMIDMGYFGVISFFIALFS